MLDKIFESINSEVLTEEVKLQISTLFEAKLNEAIDKKEKELQKEKDEEVDKIKKDSEEDIKENLKEFKSKLVEQLDSYINYFVSDFIKENQEKIVSRIELQEAENIIESFKNMIANFGYNLGYVMEGAKPDNAAKKLKVEKYVSKYNDLLKEHTKLTSKLKDFAKKEVIQEEVEKLGVSDISKDKIVSLMENMNFKTIDEISKKAKVLKDFVKNEKTGIKRDGRDGKMSVLKESNEIDENDIMSKYKNLL